MKGHNQYGGTDSHSHISFTSDLRSALQLLVQEVQQSESTSSAPVFILSSVTLPPYTKIEVVCLYMMLRDMLWITMY